MLRNDDYHNRNFPAGCKKKFLNSKKILKKFYPTPADQTSSRSDYDNPSDRGLYGNEVPRVSLSPSEKPAFPLERSYPLSFAPGNSDRGAENGQIEKR